MRIRTIKPEFFTHEGLFEMEREMQLPIRVAYAGLWCAADREGRFKWEPRRLGAVILPYDNVEFSRVLDACLTRGLLVKYRVGEAWFGAIPSWNRHQHVNPRESASIIPSIDDASEIYDACMTREARVVDATVHAQVGKEGKGKERKEDNASGTRHVFVPPSPEEVTAYAASISYPMDGEAWCDSYAQKGWLVGKNKMKDWRAAVRNWKNNGYTPTKSTSAGIPRELAENGWNA